MIACACDLKLNNGQVLNNSGCQPCFLLGLCSLRHTHTTHAIHTLGLGLFIFFIYRSTHDDNTGHRYLKVCIHALSVFSIHAMHAPTCHQLGVLLLLPRWGNVNGALRLRDAICGLVKGP